MPSNARIWIAREQLSVSNWIAELGEANRLRREVRLTEASVTAQRDLLGQHSTATPKPTVRSAALPHSALSEERAQASEVERLVFSGVNLERSKRGLPALRADSTLTDLARAHSEDMAANEYFSHDNRSGLDPTQRAVRTGYRCRKDFGSYYTDGIAENIFQNWTYSSSMYGGLIKSYKSVKEIAESTVQGWIDSPGHLANITDRNFDRVGTGVAIASDGKVMITQDFC
jgi:uncharacterized protein YkwD